MKKNLFVIVKNTPDVCPYCGTYSPGGYICTSCGVDKDSM